VAINRALFSSASERWGTPPEVYAALDAEFVFTLDPCPLDYTEGVTQNGLALSWIGHRVYCNPPYGRSVGRWLAKGREADVAVYLLPARTDTKWFHDYCLGAREIRFLRGRLRFGGATSPAPFPSMIVVM
jgi:hypothetical protein